MKIKLLAAAEVLGIGIGSAYADGRGWPRCLFVVNPASSRHRPAPNAAGASTVASNQARRLPLS
jgi:hypothetical protein